MARPISDEELQLKRRARRRLIGAIVLVTGLVIALPMVLDSEPGPVGGEVDIKIPAPDSGRFTSRVVPVPSPADPEPARGSPAAESNPPSATPRLAAALGEEPAGAPRETPGKGTASEAPLQAESIRREKPAVTQPAAPPAAPAAPVGRKSGSGYSVQVVALADAEKVKEVRARIEAAGLKSYTETVSTAKGDVTRVRTGPYPDRAAAEKARDRLKSIGLTGNIVTK